jgi:hypothetical protein
MKKDDSRVVLMSDLIINSPTAYLSDLPDDLKAAIRKAFLEAAIKNKAAFEKLSDGKNRPWEAIDNKAYDQTIELIKFVDNLKKSITLQSSGTTQPCLSILRGQSRGNSHPTIPGNTNKAHAACLRVGHSGASAAHHCGGRGARYLHCDRGLRRGSRSREAILKHRQVHELHRPSVFPR